MAVFFLLIMAALMLRIFWIFINLNEKAGYKIMLRLGKQVFIALLKFSGLASMVTVSEHTKCISLINQPCMARPTLTDLNPHKYNQGLCYSTFMVTSEYML